MISKFEDTKHEKVSVPKVSVIKDIRHQSCLPKSTEIKQTPRKGEEAHYAYQLPFKSSPQQAFFMVQ